MIQSSRIKMQMIICEFDVENIVVGKKESGKSLSFYTKIAETFILSFNKISQNLFLICIILSKFFLALRSLRQNLEEMDFLQEGQELRSPGKIVS